MVQHEEPSLRAFCHQILREGNLAAKLGTPPGRLQREVPPVPERCPRPARAPGLEMGSGAGRLPPPGSFRDPAARCRVLARLAHHELQAVELFAWALLRWPQVPRDLQDGWLCVLGEEQRHCRLYLERLAAHAAALEDFAPHSDYFWRFEPALDAAAQGPAAFLCAMGLTLEQANLDFSRLYAEAFRAAGDAATARVCEEVHRDEVGHVALAARWLRRLCPRSDGDDVARYELLVPFPLSAARAKGRAFDAAARRRAGLSSAFIAHVHAARSSQELRGRRKPPA